MRFRSIFAPFLVAVVGAAACGETATLPVSAGTGPDPALPPPPRGGLFPTVNIARARAWPAGAAPVAAPGLAATAFAEGLDHPRWPHALPSGDLVPDYMTSVREGGF